MISFLDMNITSVNSDMIPFTGSSMCRQAVDNNTISQIYSEFRVVAFGIRIRNILPSTAAPVTVGIATVPQASSGPGPNWWNNTTSTPGGNFAITEYLGMTPTFSSRFGTTITCLPNFERFTSQDVIDKCVVIPGRPTDARAFDMRTTFSQSLAYTGVSPNLEVDSVIVDSAGTVLTALSDNKMSYTGEGWSALLIEVIPNTSTVSGACLEIEYTYHLEGIPTNFNGQSTGGPYGVTQNGIAGGANANSWGRKASQAATHLADLAYANSDALYQITSAAVGGMFRAATKSSTVLATQY